MSLGITDLTQLFSARWRPSTEVAEMLAGIGLCPLSLSQDAEGRYKAPKFAGWQTIAPAESLQMIRDRAAAQTPQGVGCRVHRSLWWADFDAPGKDAGRIDELLDWLKSPDSIGMTNSEAGRLIKSFRLGGRGGVNIPFLPHLGMLPLFEKQNKVKIKRPGGGEVELYGTAAETGGAQIAVVTSPKSKEPFSGDLWEISDGLAERIVAFVCRQSPARPATDCTQAGLLVNTAPSVQAAGDDSLDWPGYRSWIERRLRGICAGMVRRIESIGNASGRHDSYRDACISLGGYLAGYERADLAGEFLAELSAAYSRAVPERAGEAVRVGMDGLKYGSERPIRFEDDSGPRPICKQPLGSSTTKAAGTESRDDQPRSGIERIRAILRRRSS